MFCPKCATQNIEGASYCRVCGANISLVPQALSCKLASGRHDLSVGVTKIQRRRKQRQPTVASGIQEIMSGIGFFVVSLMVMRFAPAGRIWWFWLLIPAFINLGKGISEIMRSRQTSFADQIPAAQLRPGAPPPSNLTAPPTGELLAAPPSVTERTTRHLGMEAPTQNRDASDELRK